MNSFMNLFIDQHISMCMFVIHFILSHIEIACNITLVYIFFYKIFYIFFLYCFWLYLFLLTFWMEYLFNFPLGINVVYSILFYLKS